MSPSSKFFRSNCGNAPCLILVGTLPIWRHRLQITENKKDNQTMLMSSGRRLGTSLFVAAVISGAAVPVALTQVTPALAQKRIAPEKNPPGDIPDDQVFIEYRSPLGFSATSSTTAT